MSSKYTRSRPTLPFTTSSGTFLLNERSSLYECLVSAGITDNKKQAALCFLFNLECFEVDKSGEVSFRCDIVAHATSPSLSHHFPAALQLVEMHNRHVARSRSMSREKNRQKMARCRQRKRKVQERDEARCSSAADAAAQQLLLLSCSIRGEAPDSGDAGQQEAAPTV